MVWGSSSLKSCDSLLDRIARNDETLIDLVILPMKTFDGAALKRLAIALRRNTHLRSIAASGHYVPPEALTALGEALLENRHLAWLAIGDESMGDTGLVALCAPMHFETQGGPAAQSCTLKRLDLSRKGIGVEGMKALGKAFGNSPFMEELYLSNNPRIGNDGLEALLTTGGEFVSLTHLFLDDCQLGSKAIGCLAGHLKRSKRQWKHLKLNSNPLQPSDGTSIGLLLAHVERLDLARCNLKDETTTAMLSLDLNVEASALDVSYNDIGLDGCKALVSIFGTQPNNSLKELSIAGNDIGEDGAKVLSSLSLDQIDACSTRCGPEGAAALVQKAVKIRLFQNQLGNDGFQAISRLLPRCTSLKELDLGGNMAETDAVLELLRSLPDNLETLELGGNATSFEVEQVICQLLEDRPGLDIARDKPRAPADGVE